MRLYEAIHLIKSGKATRFFDPGRKDCQWGFQGPENKLIFERISQTGHVTEKSEAGETASQAIHSDILYKTVNWKVR